MKIDLPGAWHVKVIHGDKIKIFQGQIDQPTPINQLRSINSAKGRHGHPSVKLEDLASDSTRTGTYELELATICLPACPRQNSSCCYRRSGKAESRPSMLGAIIRQNGVFTRVYRDDAWASNNMMGRSVFPEGMLVWLSRGSNYVKKGSTSESIMVERTHKATRSRMIHFERNSLESRCSGTLLNECGDILATKCVTGGPEFVVPNNEDTDSTEYVMTDDRDWIDRVLVGF
jgi:hypothetical protein